MSREKSRPISKIMERESISILDSAVGMLGDEFSELPSLPTALRGRRRLENVIREAVRRMKDNYPYFHPLYAGQMLKPPHPVARIAYMLSLWINPNNHALDGGRASSRMEKEAVANIARMFGWKTHVGHLTGGGTMANLEALWVSGSLNPGKMIVASEQAHYTHSRISSVLGLKFRSVGCDGNGRMDLHALEEILRTGGVGTVVATVGTTAVGSVDPLAELIELRKKYGFRLHADAAYGGYFVLVNNLPAETRRAYDLLTEVDSIVIDPHKHGLQPYGCGCVIFQDPTVARFYKHDSPYTYFTSDELHLGEISLECSRAGASAVALWATEELLPLVKEGEFAKSLSNCREAAVEFYRRLERDERFITAFQPELDIVVWAPRAGSVTGASALSRKLFNEAAKQNLHLALAELPSSLFDFGAAGMKVDSETITCLRSVLMKPEHKQWIGKIWGILDRSARMVLK